METVRSADFTTWTCADTKHMFRVLASFLVVMVAASTFYTLFVVYPQWGTLDDKAAGWPTDLMLGLAGLTMALNSRIVSSSPFTYFYIGTAIAFGLGGIGHRLEDVTSVAGRIAYYTVNTAAYGGHWLRSTYGYGMPQSWVRTAQRCFAGLVMLATTSCGIVMLVMIFRGETIEKIDESFWGKAYVEMSHMFFFVEASGALLWSAGTWEWTGKLGIIATSFNMTPWAFVKPLPNLFSGQEFVSGIPHLVFHMMQYVVLWALYTLHATRTDHKAKTKDGCEPSYPYNNSSGCA